MKNKLQRILAERKYDFLDELKDPQLWEVVPQDERKQVAMDLTMHGDEVLDEGNDALATELFDIAKQIAPDDSVIIHRQALAYASNNLHQGSLEISCSLLDQAAGLSPEDSDIWHTWGTVLIGLATLRQDPNILYEADQKFLKADSLATTPDTDLWWDWGFCWYEIGRQSGEAVDFHKALGKFKIADELGLDNEEFWNDYGNVLVELARLLGQYEILFEGIKRFEQAVACNPEYTEGWHNAGNCFQHLFEQTKDQSHFEKASECFEKASEIDEEDFLIWMQWGQLLATQGKFQHDPSLISEGIEKLEEAKYHAPDHPEVLSSLGEMFILLGVATENLDLLVEAERAIARSLELVSDDPNVWCLYGQCYSELGHYFDDEEYYLKALEKYHHGLSLDSKHPLLWYGLAMSYYAAGKLREDRGFIEKATRFYSRVLEFGDQHFAPFWHDWGQAFFKLAEMTLERSHVEAAIEKFRIAMNEMNTYELEPSLLYHYGCALHMLGEIDDETVHYEKAVQAFAKTLQLSPRFTKARRHLAVTLAHLGELLSDVDCFNKAIEQFHVAIHQDPEDEIAWNECGLAMLELAQLFYEPARPERSQNLYAQAENKLCQAVALGWAPALYNLACLHSLTHNYPAAIHYMERADSNGVLPDLEDLMHDEWLEDLRSTKQFQTFLSHMSTKQSESPE